MLTALPASIENFIENVCQSLHNSPVRPPHMIIPLNSGDGRSRSVRIIANRYYSAKACTFSSRDLFLDFTMKETIQRIYEVDAQIQSDSEYANDFHGVIAFNIDALMPHLSGVAGNKFFELVTKVKNHASLVIFVPADCVQRNIDIIAEKTGAGVKVFPAIKYSEEEYAKFFYEFLPMPVRPSDTMQNGRKAVKKAKFSLPFLSSPVKNEDVFETYKNNIISYIAKNVKNKTIANIKEAAEAVFFDDDAKEILFGKINKSKESEVFKR